MKHPADFQPQIAVHIHGSFAAAPVRAKILGGDPVRSARGRPVAVSARSGGEASGVCPGDPLAGATHPVTTSGIVDPFAVAAAFPQRWSAYLRAAYRSFYEVMAVFDVSERTARTWWAGEAGCRAPHLVVALNTDPQRASEMLLD